jgi:hypothetical protein
LAAVGAAGAGACANAADATQAAATLPKATCQGRNDVIFTSLVVGFDCKVRIGCDPAARLTAPGKGPKNRE